MSVMKWNWQMCFLLVPKFSTVQMAQNRWGDTLMSSAKIWYDSFLSVIKISMRDTLHFVQNILS